LETENAGKTSPFVEEIVEEAMKIGSLGLPTRVSHAQL